MVVGELKRWRTGPRRTYKLGNQSLANWHVGELVVGEVTRWRTIPCLCVLGDFHVSDQMDIIYHWLLQDKCWTFFDLLSKKMRSFFAYFIVKCERQYDLLMRYVDAEVRKVFYLVHARSSLNSFVDYRKRQAMHDWHFVRNIHVFHGMSSVPQNQNQFATNTIKR